MSEFLKRIPEITIACPSCGHENPGQYRFCGMCGTPLPRIDTSLTEGSRLMARRAESQAPPPRVQPPARDPDTEAVPHRDSAISGPSFLGLDAPSDRSADYLLEEESSSHWRIYTAIIVLGLVALLFWIQLGKNKLDRAYLKDLAHRFTAVLNSQKSSTPPVPDNATTDQKASDAAAVNDQHTSPTAPANTTQPPASQTSSGQAGGSQTPPASQAASSQASPGEKSAASDSEKAPTNTTSLPEEAKKQSADKGAPASSTTSADQPQDSADSTAAENTSDKTSASHAGRRPAATQSTTSGAAAQDAANAGLLAKADALLYSSGASQDCERAVGYLRQAAENESIKAKARLGTLYATGHCVPLDRPSAYRWFAIALRQDRSNASIEHNLQMLWNQMTPEEKQLAVHMSQ